jgi:hypothetical protein
MADSLGKVKQKIKNSNLFKFVEPGIPPEVNRMDYPPSIASTYALFISR